MNYFPKITKEKQKGFVGQSYFQNLVINEWGWLYHPNSQENDYGIDAYIEIVENGNVTGKLIGVQIKYGKTYFKNKRNNRILFYGENKHLNYYQNSNVPVVLIIINDNFKEIYWEKFDINKIFPTNNGWSIEIICKEINKKEIECVAGPIIDYAEEIKTLNQIYKLMISMNFYLIVIPKEDILNLDYSKIINHFEYLSKNSRVLEKKYQSMDICIYGYDNDSRELYEIPEVIKWFKESIKYSIPWFYFLATDKSNVGHKLLLLSTLKKIKKKKVGNGYFIYFDGNDVANYLLLNYPILNEFMEKHGLDLKLNKKICNNICRKYEEEFITPKG